MSSRHPPRSTWLTLGPPTCLCPASLEECITMASDRSDIYLDTSFRAALRRLDAAGRLVKVRRQVSTACEIAALMKRYDGDRALFFENVAGYSMPLVGNVIASRAN